MQPVKYLKEMFSIDEGTLVDTAVDLGLGSAPMISNVLQTFKIKRLEKRMKLNEEQLLKLKDKIESSQNEVFYKQEIFPTIVGKLMDDDDDEKSKIMIDGFEHIIDNNILEAERIYHYYDVLSELRYSDIVLFVEKYMPYDMKKNPRLNIKLELTRDMDKAQRQKYNEGKALESYQNNKFLRLGLIEVKAMKKNEGGLIFKVINPQDSDLKISDFGRRFLEFFSFNESE